MLWQKGDWQGSKYIIADKGYDTYDVRACITEAEKIPVIPRKKNALYPGVKDKLLYRTRSAIERFFAHIKEHKRIAMRYDKLDNTFLAFWAIACMKVLNLLC
jgi:transposase